MSEVREILIKARAVLAKGWTKHAFARDARNDSVHVHHTNACSFCIRGAFHRVEPAYDNMASYKAMEIIRDVIGTSSIAHYNDNIAEDQHEVLSVFDQAIDRVPE